MGQRITNNSTEGTMSFQLYCVCSISRGKLGRDDLCGKISLPVDHVSLSWQPTELDKEVMASRSEAGRNGHAKVFTGERAGGQLRAWWICPVSSFYQVR